jgi:hypothetical protein
VYESGHQRISQIKLWGNERTVFKILYRLLDRYEQKNEEIWQIENHDEQGIMKEHLQTALLRTQN